MDEVLQVAAHLCQQDRSLVESHRNEFSRTLAECGQSFVDLSPPKSVYEALLQGNTVLAFSDNSDSVDKSLQGSLVKQSWSLPEIERMATDTELFTAELRQKAGSAYINRLLASEPLGTAAAEARLLETGCTESAFDNETKALAVRRYAEGLPLESLIALVETLGPLFKRPDMMPNHHAPYQAGNRAEAREALDQPDHWQVVTRAGVPYALSQDLLIHLNPSRFARLMVNHLSAKSELSHLNRAYVQLENMYLLAFAGRGRFGGTVNADLFYQHLTSVEGMVQAKFQRANEQDRVILLADDGRGMHKKLNGIARQVMSSHVK
jgi:hypothetical protein